MITTKGSFPHLSRPNYSGFVVIGAGLPRTGTASTRAALSILLEGKIYHMFSVAEGDQVDRNLWTKAMENKATSQDFREALDKRGYRGGVDYPISLFLKELMLAYPDAKVIMSGRDPRSWYKSVRDSIYSMNKNVFNNPVVRIFLRLTGRLETAELITRLSFHNHHPMEQGLFGAIEAGEEASVSFYESAVNEVRRIVPQEKLLEFDVKEGWTPLCRFLELDEPNQPFPNVNDTANIKRNGDRLLLVAHLVVFGLPILVAGAVAALGYKFEYFKF